jgi:2'-5' RNA ligase
MGCTANGNRPPAEKLLNVFALVIYVPNPLGRFLDDLRRELVPGCKPHAHVSVLPPRALAVDWPVAGEQLRAFADNWAPFEIALGGLRIFPVTNVIYLELDRGAEELRRMHALLNNGVLSSEEPFLYHPHITLAQELAPEDVDRVNSLAQRRWSEFAGPRAFRAERTAFVRNTLGNEWIDLAEFPLSVFVG